MTERILKTIGERYPLTERDAGEYAQMNVMGIAFTARCFTAKGLGNVSLMHGAVPGMMEMDTVVVNPFERDMALFSYDRIFVPNADTLFLEMYDTRISHSPDTSKLAQLIAGFGDLADSPIASAWYDDILFAESVKKTGTREQTARLDAFTQAYLAEYLDMCALAPACDAAQKRKAASAYTEGLLNNGGASTDNFLKAKGKPFTQGLFRNVLFGTGSPDENAK